ncbi:hypothetical protein HOG48_00990 [Candidatus Peregrinibacteria bacterium]|jgi:hypothetical protein|nr:hypothetical protein [Candidatus Peregrinibacteria bacterium]
MTDAKTKLGKVDPYEYDSSQFKAELKASLMREYRKKYGVEEWAGVQPVRKPFGFKLAFAPIMAVLVLMTFVGYEYFAQPMTAYAYLKKVEKHHKVLKKSGTQVRTTHTIGNTVYEIESRKDKEGNIQVNVATGGVEVEDFVVKDGVLYVRSEFEEEVLEEAMLMAAPEAAESALVKKQISKTEKLEGLTSVLNSIVLAEMADPQDEWAKLMEEEGVELTEKEDGVVMITFEEEIDGEVFENELYFKDFEPIRKLKKSKQVMNSRAIAKISTKEFEDAVEIIEYKELSPLKERVESHEYEIFVDNDSFNEKVVQLIENEVDELVEEYAELPDKDKYFEVWDKKLANVNIPNEREIEASVLAVDTKEIPVLELLVAPPLAEKVLSDKPVEIGLVEREGEVVTKLLLEEEALKLSPLPVEREMVEPLKLPEKSLEAMPEKNLRDVYLEEVFFDLLDEKEIEKEVPELPKEEILKKREVEMEGEVKTVELPKSEESPYVAPKVIEPVTTLPVLKEKVIDVRLIDNSLPGKSYMAEPIDPFLPEHDVKTSPPEDDSKESGTSFDEVLKNRQELQEKAVTERFRVRMESETRELELKEREITPIKFDTVDDEPKSEFTR